MSLVNPPRLRDGDTALGRQLNDFVTAEPQVTPAARRAVFDGVQRRLGVGGVSRLVLVTAFAMVLLAFGVTVLRSSEPRAVVPAPVAAAPSMSVLLASASAKLFDGSMEHAPSAWGARSFSALVTADAPLVMSGSGTTLAVLPKSRVARAEVLRVEEGTLAARTSQALVVLAGDAEVRLRGAGAVTVEQGAARVSVFEGTAEVLQAGRRQSLVAGATWPSGSDLVAGAPLLALVRPPLARVDVVASGPVSVDGVLLGAPPLSTSLATGLHVFAALGVEQQVVLEEGAAVTVTLRRPQVVLDEARAATTTNPQRALELYDQVRHGFNAEVALYERALLQHRLRDEAGALATLDSSRERFPDGVLVMETALTRAEVLVSLGRRDDAIAALSAFLDTFPTSERGPEVHLLRGDLLREGGRCREAMNDLSAAKRDARWADEASWSMVACAQGSRQALERYLEAFPSGAHAAEARRALSP